MPKIRNTDLVVGIVVFISLIILVGGVMYLKEVSFTAEPQKIQAYFSQISNLTKGDPVRINGVKQGKVVDIRLQENHVLVTMEINKEVVITEGSRITIQNIGLMGERMVGIQLGAYGTKVVNEFVIRLVTASIILLCVLSRLVNIPVYLRQLDYLHYAPRFDAWLGGASKVLLYASGIAGVAIILSFVFRAWYQRRRVQASLVEAGES